MKNPFLIRIFSVALALFLAGCLTAHANNETWTSSSSGNWGTGSNWSTLSAPGSTTTTNNTDTATFSSTGVTVTIDQAGQNIGSISFSGYSTGAFIIGGSGSNGGGNPLGLSSGGSITDSITSGYPYVTETVNAPLVLEPASSTTAGAYSFTNAAFNLSDEYFPSAGDFLNIAGNVSGGTTSSTITLNLNGTNTGYTTVNDNTISGVISNGNAAGGLGITKSGTGTWLLTNANTYSGTTTINGGTLGASLLANGYVASGIGTSGYGAANLLINGGALQYTGSGASTNRLFTINGATAGATATLDASGSGAVNFTNTGSVAYGTADQTRTLILTGTNTNNNTLAALVADNGTGATSLTKSGPGTWVLTNQNTYTGTTTINGGTLSFGGGFINSSSALVLGGGALNLTTAGSSAQTFNGTTIASGASAVSAAAGETIALNAITRNIGGTVDFSSTGTITTSTTTNRGGILGSYATFGGTTWAVAPSVPGDPITGLASASYYTTTTGANTAGNYTAKNVDVTSSPVLSAGVTVNSLRFNTGAPETLTLQGTNTLANGGILVTSNVGSNASTITGGSLRAGPSADLVVIQNNTSGPLTINSVIANNGTTGLTKSGAGTLILGGTNTYTGTTTLNAGTLELSHPGALGAQSASLTINGGTLNLNGNGQAVGALNGTGGTIDDIGSLVIGYNNASGAYAGAIVHNIPYNGIILTKVGTGTETLSGAIASGGQLNINGGTIAVGPGGSIQFLLGINLNVSGTTLDISAGGNQAIGLSGAAGSTVNLGGNTLGLSENYSGTPTFAGVIEGNGGSLIITNGVLVTLTGVNTYSGQTVISAGTLDIGAGGSIAASSVVNLSNSGAIFDISAGGNQAIQDLTGVAGSTVNLGANTLTAGTANSTLFAGVIQGGGGLTKQNAGALALTNATGNTYSGGTTVSAGTLYVNNTSGSGTGTGGVTVNSGGTLAGSGRIAPTSGTGVTVNSGGTLYSGGVASGTPATGPGTGMTLNNSAGLSSILSVSGDAPANLTFALGSGNSGIVSTPASGFSNPNNNTTYMTVVAGNSNPIIDFSGPVSVTLVDLTNGALSLRMGTPYLLIQAYSIALGVNQLGDDALYSGLVTSPTDNINNLALDGNGYVMGVGTLSSYTPISIIQLGSDGVSPLTGGNIYGDAQLYLYNGDLEVVPEPGTWALLLGGLGLLAFWRARTRPSLV